MEIIASGVTIILVAAITCLAILMGPDIKVP